jgi:hypothetical protein
MVVLLAADQDIGGGGAMTVAMATAAAAVKPSPWVSVMSECFDRPAPATSTPPPALGHSLKISSLPESAAAAHRTQPSTATGRRPRWRSDQRWERGEASAMPLTATTAAAAAAARQLATMAVGARLARSSRAIGPAAQTPTETGWEPS